jgi:hypothetical protein
MIMHFNYAYKTYGDANRYVNKMITSAMRADIAANKTDAIVKLQFWSVIILNDFREANSSTRNNHLIGQHGLIDELLGCNEKLARQHTKLLANEAKQEQILSELAKTNTEVESLRTLCQSMRDHLGTIHTVCLRMETGMKQVMQKNQLDYGPATPQLQNVMARIQENLPVSQLTPPPEFLPQLQVTPATHPAAAQPVPESQPTPGPITQPLPLPQPRRLMAALPLNNQTSTRGKSKPGQTVEKVLRFMYDQPNNAAFASLAAGATTELHHQTTFVFTNIFQSSCRQDRLKIERALMLVDCMWTEAERNNFVHHRLPNMESIRSALEIQKRVVDAAHVLKKNQNKPRNTKGKGGLLGLANNIGTFDLKPYLPDWSNGGRTPSERTLFEIVEEKRQEIISNNTSS